MSDIDLGAMPDSSGILIVLLTVMLVISAILIILGIVAMWKINLKAGKPGWAAIVPFYNIVVLLEIVSRPAWWLILFFIPIVNIIFGIIVIFDLGKAFGKSGVFSFFLLFLLSIIGYMILAFDKSEYKKIVRNSGSSR